MTDYLRYGFARAAIFFLERFGDGNGKPIIFYQWPDFAGTVLVGLFASFRGHWCAWSIEASANNNPVLELIVLVLHVWIAICITVKRLHDIDVSGWFSIPIVLIPIAVILAGSFPGTVGPNQYGPDPLQRPSSNL